MDYSIKSLSFNKLVNTAYFCEAANDYKKNIVKWNGDEKHVYCKAPIGSDEWNQYWDLQELRCAEGYTVGDLKITGRQYYYLNFFPMTQPVIKGTDTNKVIDTGTDFPSFMMIQWLWYSFKHIARYGGTFLGIESEGGKNMCGLKTRSSGFSYMNAADGGFNFQFKDGSKTFYVGHSSEVITDGIDSTLLKVESGLDWLNNETGGVDKNGRFVMTNGQPFGEWRKNRTGSIDEGWIAQWKDKGGYGHGSKSGISPVICNTPRKVRGKRGDIIIEEAGSFPNLLEVLSILRGNIDMSGYKMGQITMFGTGGEQGPGIEALEKVFWNPDAYEMLSFPNIWEEAENEKVGFFCPVYFGRLSDSDSNGNPNPTKTINTEKRIRSEQTDAKEADRRIAEYPFTPSEALKRLSNNKFPQKEIDTQIKLLTTNRAMMNRVQTGTIERWKDGYRLEPSEHEPIRHYPIKSTEKNEDGSIKTIDLHGCVEILQHPLMNEKGRVYEDVYFMTVDCYSVDDVGEIISLYACHIWKHWNIHDNEFSRSPVAWFVGRREKQEDCFEISYRMCEYYGGAKMMGEHNAQGQLLINYIRGKQRTDLLMRESDLYHNRSSKKKSKNYFQNVTADAKLTNIGMLVDLFKERIAFDEDTDEAITWVSNCYEIGLLRETSKFNPIKGNFDRVSSCILAPMILKDKAMVDAYPSEEEEEYDTRIIDELEEYTQITNGYITAY